METAGNKENVAPATSSDPLQRKDTSLSPKKTARRGRSKSIGPGSLEEPEQPKQKAKDRRKSAFVPATKSILAKNEESERTARRKSMMNRRVSFAPEATLHTWDIVEYDKNHTTSTDDTESTGHASSFGRFSSSPRARFDEEQEAEDAELLSPPASQSDGRAKLKNRRSSGIPPMNFNNPEDAYSSGMSDGSEGSESEGEESGDDTGTAMSLDADDATMQSSAESDNSTGSSARLEAALKQAAQMAGTRGIEYDEYGETSMELVSEEVTNAFKPWAQRQPSDAPGSASLDQENVNPFSPAFKADVENRPETIDEEDEEDMSMDVTKAVGGILKARPPQPASSPMSDGTMDLTQAVGKITSQKRPRSTTDSGSPGGAGLALQPKRRRSSVARSSMGDDTMDLTMAVGGIQKTASPNKSGRRRSLRNRRSSGAISDQEEATMDLTRAVGGIRTSKSDVDNSLDGNEELSMELTTVLGGIKSAEQPASVNEDRPATPQDAPSPAPSAVNTTPKGQERFKDTPDLGAKKLLTPILQRSSEKQTASGKSRASLSPRRQATPQEPSPRASSVKSEPKTSPLKDDVSYPQLPPTDPQSSPIRTPMSSLKRREHQRQLDFQLQAPDQSPTAAKQQRSSPVKAQAATPERLNVAEDTRDLTNSMKLLTTPRKEPLKTATPRKQATVKQLSPITASTPRSRPTPKAKDSTAVLPSPVRRLNEDLDRIKANGQETEKVGLQEFLDKSGIRFMDLTTTKRRLTVMPTPSKAKAGLDDDEDITLESGVVAAACTVPELELYQHACHELKRYTKEGKQMISKLENRVLKQQPPLIQAYMSAAPDRKAALDTQMRDLKTDARLGSKGMWYGWRSQLLDELMTGLQSIAEGLIQDDDTLGRSEEILDQVLPGLIEQRNKLQQEADRLEESVSSVSEEEKGELKATRETLTGVNSELIERQRVLDRLRKEVEEQDSAAEHLQESKEEFTAAIQEANRVREACRGVSLNEVTALRDSVKHLQDEFGWIITSASSYPSTVTMSYKSELQLFFHPQSFKRSDDDGEEAPNGPIRLTYIADTNKKPLTTTLRFFLQLLRASLHGIPQYSTKISDLLAFVSNGWATAAQAAECERRLNLEALTESRIVSDEQLAITSSVLLTKVRSKVRATFELDVHVDEDLKVQCAVKPSVEVVYGEQYNEKNMTEFLRTLVGDGVEGWDLALRQMRQKLIARGAKGARK
ncbi:hypothetical protein M409DRAFT_62950 [Zasmidium cellare ATCC 36951]|uniref:Spc7 kinetochore protein domain-containing protein n=1 Tax=Zasmidium cellare ATCC 36951 TaxID=1080233 RepID=A0A6A6D192_ZASCE|nr:uncharacterized protein M409DRAFT_62950 [Zasmidium cellare ATCC 36951]KAF2172188.1 hypothetical protein M409DRAFT_62950 [Zasmidium cellare ATCC 36951]